MNSLIYASEYNKVRVIDLNKEYDCSNLEIPYAIVTDLLEVCLKRAYPNVIKKYRPYVLLTVEMYEAMYDSQKNDHREHFREGNLHDSLSLEAAMSLVDEFSSPVRICESLYTLDCIFKKMRELPHKIGPRVYKRYVIGFTVREIAEQENSNIWVVLKCLERALPDIHDIFVEEGVVV